MCIGIPAQIVAINDDDSGLADINGVRRQINLALVGSYDEHGISRLGQWVLVHVGFAMSVIDEQQANETLTGLQQVFDAEYLEQGEN